jgi:D-aminoacyl-tRNA deacylase
MKGWVTVRAVLQRVNEARVVVSGNLVAEIGKGLLVFLGAGKGDTEKDVRWMVEKIVGLRVFPDEQDRMNLSLADIGGQVLVVSQFTLFGDCRKGKRPSFTGALEPAEAERLCNLFITLVNDRGLVCGSGIFGADMKVSLINDGPVTLLVDSHLPRHAGEEGFSSSET